MRERLRSMIAPTIAALYDPDAYSSLAGPPPLFGEFHAGVAKARRRSKERGKRGARC